MRHFPIGNGMATARVPKEFAALMDALQCEGANFDALFRLDQEEWSKLLLLCDVAHLTFALAELDLAGFPQWVFRRLEDNEADNSRRYQRLLATYREAANALDSVNVAHLVLKGFSQFPDYVSNPRLRMQSDLDVYCPREQIAAARNALTAIGYESAPGHDAERADHEPALRRPSLWKWRGNMFDPEMPASVELHFCFWNDKATLIDLSETDGFWDRRVMRHVDRVDFAALCPVDQFGYLCLHILRDVFRGDWVVHRVYELAKFLHARAKDAEFWAEWSTTHSPELRSTEAIAMGLARCWFSCSVSGCVREQLEALPDAVREWLARFCGSPLEAMFRGNKDGSLLQMMLAPTPAARRSVLRRAMLPPTVAGPGAAAVRIQHRLSIARSADNRAVAYMKYLFKRSASHCAANLRFLFHGSELWLSRKSLRADFWIFVGASFFLTWACRSISFSSIFF